MSILSVDGWWVDNIDNCQVCLRYGGYIEFTLFIVLTENLKLF